VKAETFEEKALVAWHSGHLVCLHNKRSRVQIPSGCKGFRSLYIAVLLLKLNMHCHCVTLKKKSSKIKKTFEDTSK
jgi:hypothetical protein